MTARALRKLLGKGFAVRRPFKLVVLYRDDICWTIIIPGDSDRCSPFGVAQCGNLSVKYDLAVLGILDTKAFDERGSCHLSSHTK